MSYPREDAERIVVRNDWPEADGQQWPSPVEIEEALTQEFTFHRPIEGVS